MGIWEWEKYGNMGMGEIWEYGNGRNMGIWEWEKYGNMGMRGIWNMGMGLNWSRPASYEDTLALFTYSRVLNHDE